MFAVTGLTELAQQTMCLAADHQHAAILDVGREDVTLRGSIASSGFCIAGFSAGNAGGPISLDDPPARHVDLADDEVVLLGGDDHLAVGGEERIVGQLEGLARREVTGRGKAP